MLPQQGGVPLRGGGLHPLPGRLQRIHPDIGPRIREVRREIRLVVSVGGKIEHDLVGAGSLQNAILVGSLAAVRRHPDAHGKLHPVVLQGS